MAYTTFLIPSTKHASLPNSSRLNPRDIPLLASPHHIQSISKSLLLYLKNIPKICLRFFFFFDLKLQSATIGTEVSTVSLSLFFFLIKPMDWPLLGQVYTTGPIIWTRAKSRYTAMFSGGCGKDGDD